MNNKKGFSLVELSVVLVVIGAIIFIAMKVSGAINASRLNSELSKVNAIQSAFSSYYERFNKFPGQAAGSSTISLGQTVNARNDLIRAGLVDEGTFMFGARDQLGATNDYWWTFIRCVPMAADYAIINSDAVNTTFPVRGNICISLNNTQAGADTGFATPHRIYGAYELFIDDKNVSTGLGRGNVLSSLPVAEKAPESLVDSAVFAEGTTISEIYAVQIFRTM